MSQILLLDSGPLGLITQPRISEEVVAINRWLVSRLLAGDAVIVPAIVYYEIRRELLRQRSPRVWLGWTRLLKVILSDIFS